MPVPGYYESERSEVVELVPAAGARILDVGCGAGAMGAAMLARGAREVVGVEVVPEMAAIARGRLGAVHALDLQRCLPLPYPDGHFDVITCADVLEHLVDPAAVLRHLHRYLSPRGQLICSIPNVRHESVVLRLLVEGRWRYEDHGILDRTHLRFYTLEELRLLLREGGFSQPDRPATVRSDASPYLDRAAALVEQLGGDVARFRDEATVVQYLTTSRPVGHHIDGENPWHGARPMRVLVAPAWDDTSLRDDRWATPLLGFCNRIGAADPITIGVVAPPGVFSALPPVFLRLLASASADIRVLAAPASPSHWDAILSGAKVLLPTGADEVLEARARKAGVRLLNGRAGSAAG